MPTVDFARELVVVATSNKLVIDHIAGRGDDKGDVLVAIAVKAGEKGKGKEKDKEIKGFTYGIAVLKREGIKTINGKEIPKK